MLAEPPPLSDTCRPGGVCAFVACPPIALPLPWAAMLLLPPRPVFVVLPWLAMLLLPPRPVFVVLPWAAMLLLPPRPVFVVLPCAAMLLLVVLPRPIVLFPPRLCMFEFAGCCAGAEL